MAAAVQDVTDGGVPCSTYADCLAKLDAGEDIDYDGVSGAIAFDAKGDPQGAVIGMYRYGKDNKFTRID